MLGIDPLRPSASSQLDGNGSGPSTELRKPAKSAHPLSLTTGLMSGEQDEGSAGGHVESHVARDRLDREERRRESAPRRPAASALRGMWMTGIPEIRDLFRPRPRRRYGDIGWLLGEDLGADIVLMDDGTVAAVTNDRTVLVNSCLERYITSLGLVGGLRDHLLLHADDDVSIAECEGSVRTVDEATYGNYWSLVLEEIKAEQF